MALSMIWAFYKTREKRPDVSHLVGEFIRMSLQMNGVRESRKAQQMKSFISIATAGFLAASLNSVAQTQDTFMSGWGPSSAYNHAYSTGKERTISGKILSIDTSQKPSAAMSPGTDIKIRSNGHTEDVQLGPTWYFRDLSTHLAVGNTVKVTGNDVSFNGHEVIMARKLAKGNRVLYLRDLSGFPMWVAVHPVYDQGRVASNSATSSSNDPNVGDSPFGPVGFTPIPPPQQPINSTPPSSSAAAKVAQQTLQGTLQSVVNYTNPQTGQAESYMVVNTQQGPVNVDLGPQWYVDQQGVNWTPTSHILVNGVPVAGDAIKWGPTGMTYSANSVGFSNQVMVLRNGSVPIWSPWFGN
jgi:hypothetical protein